MADLICDSQENYTKRFQCGCLDPIHALDLSIELTDGGRRILIVDFSEKYFGDKRPFLWRLKDTIRLLCGKNICPYNFIIRREDIGEMIEMLEVAKGIETDILFGKPKSGD